MPALGQVGRERAPTPLRAGRKGSGRRLLRRDPAGLQRVKEDRGPHPTTVHRQLSVIRSQALSSCLVNGGPQECPQSVFGKHKSDLPWRQGLGPVCTLACSFLRGELWHIAVLTTEETETSAGPCAQEDAENRYQWTVRSLHCGLLRWLPDT